MYIPRVPPFYLFLILSCFSLIVSAQNSRHGTYPSIFLVQESIDGFTSVSDLKNLMKDSHQTKLWKGLMADAESDLRLPFLDPTTDFPGRDPVHLRHANVSHDLARGIETRIFRSALLFLVTGDQKYKEVVLRQIEALFDEHLWPMWCDHSHAGRGGPDVDIRTYRISMWIAIAYNWLHDHLSREERTYILKGLDRRAIQPFWEKIKTRPSWYIHRHNWFTNIFGGMGITAMALGDDHPETQRLLDTIVPQMVAFNKVFGDMGEFNEPPGYSGAVRFSVEFAEAYRYYTGDSENLLRGSPFLDVAYWVLYHTLPPGRMAEFGDTKKNRGYSSPESIAAIANANDDGILQQYYLQYFGKISSPFELLWFNPRVEPKTPDGILPLGIAYRQYGADILSRSSWDPDGSHCIVYGKSGREENHDDNDVGQLLIDGFGDRLIMDVGKPDPIYPKDYFGSGQYNYYTRSSRGHNVIRIGNREMRSEPNADARGKTTSTFFDDQIGSSWTMDLSPVYGYREVVTRSVAHLFPGIVVVSDHVRLEHPDTIELRWHTGGVPRTVAPDQFYASAEKGQIVAKVVALEGDPIQMDTGQHFHQAPFDRTRQGDPIIQEYHPYVRFRTFTDTCTILTLFSVASKMENAPSWVASKKGWSIEVGSRKYEVRAKDGKLHVIDDLGKTLTIPQSLQK